MTRVHVCDPGWNTRQSLTEMNVSKEGPFHDSQMEASTPVTPTPSPTSDSPLGVPRDLPSLVSVLRWRAAAQPHLRACTYLANGEDEAGHLTYAGLDRQARSIAARLQSLGIEGQGALLLYPQGLEYVAAFLGCLYASVIAIPLYPPRPKDRSLARIHAVASDAHAVVALTTAATLPRLQAMLAQVPELGSLPCVATDSLPSDLADAWMAPAISPEMVAYLQYTSGSTGTPKGVMGTHGNLIHNLSGMEHVWELSPSSVSVSWCPIFHDMGLIIGVLLPLYGGFHDVLLPPAAFLQRPLRWLEAISRYRGTISPAPDFAFDLCARRIPPELCSALDLRSWSVAVNGAEPVRAGTLDRFVAAFEHRGFRRETFRPTYGLAETTSAVSLERPGSRPRLLPVQRVPLEGHRIIEAAGPGEGVQTLVGCGHPMPAHRIIIVDPATRTECPADQVGEIWVSGPSVAGGYWNRPEESERTFRATLADSGEGPFLRTGDLGSLRDGEVFITGRLKDVIIIRGQNHYPQDIELTVERSHPSLRPTCSAAFSIEVADGERLVVVQEVEYRQQPDPDAIVGLIRQAVAEEHGVQVHDVILLRPGTILKTSSGKIQRWACRAAYLAGRLQVWEPAAAMSAPGTEPA